MKYILIIAFLASFAACIGQNTPIEPEKKIIPAAERINVYLPFLKGKKVGVFANHTSMVGLVADGEYQRGACDGRIISTGDGRSVHGAQVIGGG